MTGSTAARSCDLSPSLEALERALARPEPFAPHDAPFWDDPHIAREMLAAHLDPGTDAGSRRPETIARTVAVWDHAYSVTALRTLLARHGLRVEAAWSDLAGTPYRRSSPTLGVLARRR